MQCLSSQFFTVDHSPDLTARCAAHSTLGSHSPQTVPQEHTTHADSCLQTKKGLSGSRAPNSSRPLGRVDSASKLKGNICVDDHGTVCDVMLNLVDVSKNSDKYFIL